ncbi:MAG: alpha/beta fold hydrolase [Proteobacteria bacterium]|nr:MAG: alpha/beta fold hydrolase [Pseudomonadota bacterium]
MSDAPQFADESNVLLIQGSAGQLEILTAPPVADAVDKDRVAIICHPHPLYGGTMRNKVTHMLEKAFREMGAYTIRFNFRGVGESDGVFDDGVGETDDLMAVFEWAKQAKPDSKFWLAGFSFGCYVAMRAVHDINPEHFVTVAPPVERYDFTELEPPACPWLMVMGEEDDVVSPRAVYEYVEAQNPKPQLVTMKAGHFFHRRLLDLKGAVKNGLLRQVNIKSED